MAYGASGGEMATWRRKVAAAASALALAGALVAAGSVMQGGGGSMTTELDMVPAGTGLFARGSRELADAMKSLQSDAKLADGAEDMVHPHRAAKMKAKKQLLAKKRKEKEDGGYSEGREAEADKKPETEAEMVKQEEDQDCEPFCGSSHSGLTVKDTFGKSLIQALAQKDINVISSTEAEDRAKDGKGDKARNGAAKREAQAIEENDCKPFCGIQSKKADATDRSSSSSAIQEHKMAVSGTGKLNDLSPSHAAAHKPLTPAVRKKIQEAADKIANVISDANSMNHGDVQREMHHINKVGTGWKALWGSSSSLSSGSKAKFDYLAAGPDGRQSHSELFGQGFRY